MTIDDPNELQKRVEREKAAYDEGLQRTLYNSVLAHGYVDYLYRKHRYAIAGDVLRANPPRRVLELGAVTWKHFLEEQNVTPEVTICINISEPELDKGREIAKGSRVAPQFMIMDAHKLEFDDAYFDVVFGVAVLHHLDLSLSYKEISRVLRPGGLMIFVEPLNVNPLAKLVRFLTPKARTPDEAAFEKAQLDFTAEKFDCRFEYEQFLTVIAGAIGKPFIAHPDNLLNRFAFRFDEGLKRMFPAIGPYYRRVLIIGRNRER